MNTSLTREEVADILSGLMSSQEKSASFGGVEMKCGGVKTYAVEASAVESSGDAHALLERIAPVYAGRVVPTRDDSMFVLGTPESAFIVDAIDPRFWLLHTTGAAQASQRIVKKLVRGQHRIDRCWFTWQFLQQLSSRQSTLWFKSDFEGREMLPEGDLARKLRIQLEGVGVVDLYRQLAGMAGYRHAAALEAVAADFRSAAGKVTELTHYNGRFVGHGDAFEAHVSFVGRALAKYRRIVEQVEREHTIEFRSAGEAGGATLSGQPLTITYRPVRDMARFIGVLFACREPFRLWGVPREVDADVWDTEAVDLHIGATLHIRVTPTHMTLILPRTTCGNTALRLLTNIQHRYDAMATWDVSSGDAAAFARTASAEVLQPA